MCPSCICPTYLKILSGKIHKLLAVFILEKKDSKWRADKRPLHILIFTLRLFFAVYVALLIIKFTKTNNKVQTHFLISIIEF